MLSPLQVAIGPPDPEEPGVLALLPVGVFPPQKTLRKLLAPPPCEGLGAKVGVAFDPTPAVEDEELVEAPELEEEILLVA